MDLDRWQEIKRLYHQAREREPGEREAFLNEACGDDETLLRARQACSVGLFPGRVGRRGCPRFAARGA